MHVFFFALKIKNIVLITRNVIPVRKENVNVNDRIFTFMVVNKT